MPTKPGKGEKQSDFHSRCMKAMADEGKPKDQANAACYGMWNKRESVEEGSLPMPRTSTGVSVPEPASTREKQYEFLARCTREVKEKNSTLTDEDAAALCLYAWSTRWESAHPADATIREVSTVDWSSVDKSRLPAECFLLAPNPQDPKTWQVPIYMGTGGIDAKTGRWRERGEINLQALRIEAARKHGIPSSTRAKLKALLAQYDILPKARYESYRTPVLQESGDKPSRLVEDINFAGAEFVEEAGQKIVKNVVMLGPESSHGYCYKQEAMSKAVSGKLYEGCRCFINHNEGGGSRNLMDLAGCFRNVRHESKKVLGDAYLLPTDGGNLFWHVAKTMPQTAGCSHVADGQLVKGADGKRYVEEITRVYSVDLVSCGATTKTVFEGDKPQGESTMEWKDIDINALKTNRPDLIHALVLEGAKTRDEEITALIGEKDGLAKEKQALVTEKETLAKANGALTEEKNQLQAKVAEQEVRETTRQKEAVVAKIVATLPEHARTEAIRNLCMQARTGKDGFDAALFEAAVTDIVKPIKEACQQTGVHNAGGEQNRDGKAKTAAEIAESALAESK